MTEELPDPLRSQIKQLVRLLTAERCSFGSALHFHQATVATHHKVGVNLGPGIFAVIKVKQWTIIHNADTDSCQRCYFWYFRKLSICMQMDNFLKYQK